MKKSAFNLFTLFALLTSLLGSAVFVTPVYAASIVVNTNADTVADDGACSLREAITAANTDTTSGATTGECVAGSGADTITFAANYTITLASQLPAVTSTIVITGNGVANTVVQASTCNPVTGKDEAGNSCTPADYRIFVVDSAGNLTINGVTIRHGKCDIFCSLGDSGGGIYNQGTLTVADSVLSDNQSGNGGGIYNISDNLTLLNVTFSNNSAIGLGGGKGGGLHNVNSAPTLTNVTFSSNNAFSGGGMENTNSSPNLKDVTFSGNTAGSSGGGMENDNSSPNLANVTFSGNKAPDGGGMYNSGSNPILNDVTFSGNEATAAFGCGGGMYNTGSAPILSNVTFSDNDAYRGGGMCNQANSNPNLISVTFLDNSASMGGGGGIYNASSSPTLTDVFFLNNLALGFGGRGGGIYNYANSSPSLVDLTFSGNRASHGGGIFNSSSNPSLTNVTFSGNNAVSGHGGGMHNENSSPRLTNVTFSDNSAVLGPGFGRGGGMYNHSGTPLLINVIIANSTNGGDCVNLNGTISALSGNNLIESAGSSACGLTNGSNNNIIGLDPSLGTLADNGGFTQTHALLTGSQAIDTGTNTDCPTTDQRGASRPQGAGCDIGAYESDSSYPVVVSTSLLENYTDNGPVSFTLTFSEAVNDPTGDTDPNDVTNPDNYLLVEAGANATFDTSACNTGLQPDDSQVTVNSVTYNSASFTSTVNINGGTSLPVGKYKLFVCGTTSIVDLSGNILAGDGTTSGTDYPFEFTVAVTTTNNTPASLPDTGFAPGRITSLPPQPASRVYTATELTLEIPKLDVSMNIVGVPQTETSWDVTWLGWDAGWLSGSAFPTWSGNTVLTGHVWDAWNQPGPFANLKTLGYGDQFFIHAYGMTYTYEVRENKLLFPKSGLRTAFQHEEYDWVTLVTCEFYNPIVDGYLFRRAVRAVLVNVQ